jgi:hypothetical protein
MSSGQEFGPAFTAGYRYGPFASGHTITLASERIADYSMRMVTYSTGAVYAVIPGTLIAGASLMHYLRLDTVRSPISKTPRTWYRSAIGLPRTARLGIAWSDTMAGEIPFTVALDGVYRDIDRDIDSVRIIVPVGAEFQMLPSLFLRIGKPFNHPTEIFHAGCGIRWLSIGFDFDYGLSRLVEGSSLEQKWLFGLTYSLPVTLSSPGSLIEKKPVKRNEQKVPVSSDTAPATAAKPVVQQPAHPKPDSVDVHAQPDSSTAVIDSSVLLDQGIVYDSLDQQVHDTIANSPAVPQAPDSSVQVPVPARRPDSIKAEEGRPGMMR